MYPNEMPYFNTENPVVRDELWNDHYYMDVEDEEEISLDLEVDASNLSDADFDELIDRLETLGHVCEAFGLDQQSDFHVNYIYKSGEEYATSFTVRGWCYEPVYDEVIDCLDYYGVNFIGA